MEWLLPALASAGFFSVLNVVTKKLTEDISGIVYTTIFTLSATAIYTPLFLYLYTGTGFEQGLLPWLAVLASGIANALGIIAYNTSIKYGEISEVIPLTKITPVFTAILGYVILGESLDPAAILGIIAVTTGSYIVLLRRQGTVLKPFKRIVHEKAPLLAFSTSLIYAAASIADRYGNQAIPPYTYGYIIFLTMSISLTTYLAARDREKLRKAKETALKKPVSYTFVGILAASAYLSIFIAYSLAPAYKVIPILQLQVLASIAAGGYLFNEENMARKIIGSATLITGVILIAI